jgi:hypothetical protein
MQLKREMRNIQATKERSEPRRLSQAFFHLLVSKRYDIGNPVLPYFPDVFCLRETDVHTPE